MANAKRRRKRSGLVWRGWALGDVEKKCRGRNCT